MFDRLIESGGHHFRHSLPGLSMPAMWSTAAHLAIVASVVYPFGAASLDRADTAADKEAVFMLPLLPSPGANKVEAVDGVTFQPGVEDGSTEPEKDKGTRPVAGERRTVPVAERAGALTESPDTSSLSQSMAYVEAELDAPAERDPLSAAPVYPETLRANGVEGRVVAQYVIDTTGYADVASFRVMDATHPLFTYAVQTALPGMHFRPAELAGRRVRQIVQQEFKFVITRETSAAAAPPADSLAPRP